MKIWGMGARLSGLVVALLLGGAVLAAGAVAAPGSIDRSFGGEGHVDVANRFVPALADDVEIGPDDSIYVMQSLKCEVGCGTSFYLQRFLPDGALDTGFGTEGFGPSVTVDDTFYSRFGRSLAVTPDGRPVVAAADGGDISVFRFAEDGTLDPSFGDGGVVRLGFGATESDPKVAVRGDGKIVLVAASRSQRSHVAITRILPSGEIDPRFGSEAARRTGPGVLKVPGFQPAAMALSSSGQIVIGGKPCCTGSRMRSVFEARRGGNGNLIGDHTPRSPWHYLRVGRNASIGAVIALPNGKVYLVGARRFGAFAAKLRPNGRLEQRYGRRGIVRLGMFRTTSPLSALVDESGRLVVVGVRQMRGFAWGGASVRRLPGGRLDRRWGEGKRVSVGIWEPVAIGRQSGGGVVVFGNESCPRGCPESERRLVRLKG